MVIIATLTNKPDYFKLAHQSVIDQTRPAEHRWLPDSVFECEPDRYPPAAFFNQVVRDADGSDYIAWLSDDDVLYPHFVEVLAGFLDIHQSVAACYGRSKHVTFDIETGESRHLRDLPTIPGLPKFDKVLTPCCKLDGGQVMMRVSALRKLGPEPAPEIIDGARVSDGRLLNKLAAASGIHPATSAYVMENRATPKSAHTASRDGELVEVDWRRNG